MAAPLSKETLFCVEYHSLTTNCQASFQENPAGLAVYLPLARSLFLPDERPLSILVFPDDYLM